MACSLSLLLACLCSACSITAPSHSPGYADLDSLGMFDVDNTFTISLGPALLRFAAAHIDDDDEAKALLKGLDGLRIRIYEIDGSSERVGQRINRMQLRLQDDGWEPVVLVRDEGSQVHLLMKTRSKRGKTRICGMTLVAMEDDGEVVVINLMGEIQPARFGDVMAALDVDSKAAREVEVVGKG